MKNKHLALGMLALAIPVLLAADYYDPNSPTNSGNRSGTTYNSTSSSNSTPATTTTTTTTYSQPTSSVNRPITNSRNYVPPPTSNAPFHSNVSKDSWHNKPTRDNYFNDPNWPNVKR